MSTIDKGAELGALHAELAAMSMGSNAERLGINPDADKLTIRKAFLGMVKRFHPHRFSHLGEECERLANEIFLAVKQAHDDMIKAANRAELAEKSAAPEPAKTAGSGPVSRPATEPRGKPAPRRRRRTSLPPTDRTSRPSAVRFRGDKAAIAEDPSKSSELRPLVAAVGGPPRPTASGTKARPSAQGTPVRPKPRAGQPRVAAPAPQPPPLKPLVDHSALVAKLESEEESKLNAYRTATKLLKEGRAGEARVQFRALAVENPTDKRYRVYMHFSWGREHELAGRFDDAATEYQRALNVNASFKPALEALESVQELNERGSGVFGRLFRKGQKK